MPPTTRNFANWATSGRMPAGAPPPPPPPPPAAAGGGAWGRGDEGLGLDSVDALELGLAVQKTFGFQLDGENDNLRDNFANVKTLAEFVRSRQAQG